MQRRRLSERRALHFGAFRVKGHVAAFRLEVLSSSIHTL